MEAIRECIWDSKQTVFFEIIYKPKENYIHCKWIGFVNEIAPSKKAYKLILSYAQRYNCARILHDNTQQVGPWPKINEWLEKVWMPSLKDVGVHFFAHVYSKNVFTQLSAQNLLDKGLSKLSLKYFYNLEPAKEWLLKQRQVYQEEQMCDSLPNSLCHCPIPNTKNIADLRAYETLKSQAPANFWSQFLSQS